MHYRLSLFNQPANFRGCPTFQRNKESPVNSLFSVCHAGTLTIYVYSASNDCILPNYPGKLNSKKLDYVINPYQYILLVITDASPNGFTMVDLKRVMASCFLFVQLSELVQSCHTYMYFLVTSHKLQRIST